MEKSFFQDDFTIRLLEVITQLTKRNANIIKGDFATGLQISRSTLDKIETHTRNYPKDLQTHAISYLNTYFFVNKTYWGDKRQLENRIKDMFFQDPPERRHVHKKTVPFHTYQSITKENEELKDENEALKKEIEELRKRLPNVAAEPDKDYDNKS